MEQEYTRIMGIDFGLKRIGIAISDPLHIFASAFTVFQNDEKLFSNLNQLISEKNIQLIILGMPSNEETSNTSIVKQVKKFKERLFKESKLEIIEWDETYTSVIAEKRIIESVNKKKNRRKKELIDMNSASVILQEYLDSRK